MSHGSTTPTIAERESIARERLSTLLLRTEMSSIQLWRISTMLGGGNDTSIADKIAGADLDRLNQVLAAFEVDTA